MWVICGAQTKGGLQTVKNVDLAMAVCSGAPLGPPCKPECTVNGYIVIKKASACGWP